jgi:hypothetical protein
MNSRNYPPGHYSRPNNWRVSRRRSFKLYHVRLCARVPLLHTAEHAISAGQTRECYINRRTVSRSPLAISLAAINLPAANYEEFCSVNNYTSYLYCLLTPPIAQLPPCEVNLAGGRRGFFLHNIYTTYGMNPLGYTRMRSKEMLPEDLTLQNWGVLLRVFHSMFPCIFHSMVQYHMLGFPSCLVTAKLIIPSLPARRGEEGGRKPTCATYIFS